MAVNTTVTVTMPQMGDSVSEGTVLEWHKHEGDQVSQDEVLVEISTDKVDAEVPAPTAGTVMKIHAAEGDTVTVGTVLAEIATGNGAATTQEARSAGHGRPDGDLPDQDAGLDDPRSSNASETVDIVMPAMGESV